MLFRQRTILSNKEKEPTKATKWTLKRSGIRVDKSILSSITTALCPRIQMFQKVTLINFKYSNNILLCFLNETKKGKRSIFSCLLKPRGYVFLLMYIENWFLHSQSVGLILTAHSALSDNIVIKHYFSKSFCYKVFHE